MIYDNYFYEQLVYTFVKGAEGIILEDLVIFWTTINPIIKEEKLLLLVDTMVAKHLLSYQQNEEGFTQIYINSWDSNLLNSIF